MSFKHIYFACRSVILHLETPVTFERPIFLGDFRNRTSVHFWSLSVTFGTVKVTGAFPDVVLMPPDVHGCRPTLNYTTFIH